MQRVGRSPNERSQAKQLLGADSSDRRPLADLRRTRHELRTLRTRMAARNEPTPDFDGIDWEGFCQQALGRKFGAAWQKIPAKNRGDWGLDGFVRGDGMVVQCYADDSVSNADQTRKQKGKLTTDVPKLRQHSTALEARLGMVVRTYVFLVPSFDDKDLLAHADAKAAVARGWGLSWIDPSFAIAIHDFDWLREEWRALRGGLRVTLDLRDAEPVPAPASGGPLAENLDRKLVAIPRLQANPSMSSDWRAWILDDYVKGIGLLRRLEDQSPQYADRITELVSAREQRLARRASAAEPLDDLNALTEELAEAIHRDVDSIADDDAARMAGAVVADWLLRCPLEYVP